MNAIEVGGIVFLFAAAFVVLLVIWFFVKALIVLLQYRIFKLTGVSIGMRYPLKYREIDTYQERILNRHIPFYHTLDDKDKRLFCHRLLTFKDSKKFEGRQGLKVSEDMRLVISAAAVKLTLGHNRYMLPHFTTIIIYPATYYSNFTRSLNKGETNQHGLVVLSWNNVLEGFADEKDRINLGYHEFAHALYMQMQTNDMHTDPRLFVHGNELKDLFNSKGGIYNEARNSGIIRDYGFVNFMEFFAVVTETFFEQPEQMRERCPALYRKLVALFGYSGIGGYHNN